MIWLIFVCGFGLFCCVDLCRQQESKQNQDAEKWSLASRKVLVEAAVELVFLRRKLEIFVAIMQPILIGLQEML